MFEHREGVNMATQSVVREEMSRANKTGLFFMSLICLALLLSQSAFAAKGISTGDLVKSSELIITGKVDKATCHFAKGTVITQATIKVSEVLSGNVDKKDIIVEYEGGKVGDLELKLTDAVTLTKGEEIILFLKTAQSKLAGKTVFVISGEAQGKYTIKRGIAIPIHTSPASNYDTSRPLLDTRYRVCPG
ncbi:MAG: hypothetical protein HQK97_11135 [Nitrospirae bacterium]|nr:hypothetical protein [Nitrospirota bacterium]